MNRRLATHYVGLELEHPFIATAGPATGTLARLRELERAGAAAVVLPSLFEEQIESDEYELQRLREFGSDALAEALSYFPPVYSSALGPSRYLELVSDAAATLSIPVIGSLNGHTRGGWVDFAHAIEEAGASALELNLYEVLADSNVPAGQIESRYVDVVRAVRQRIDIPLVVKIGPYFTSLAHFAHQLERAGANGIVLFSRFLQPDLDVETREVRPTFVPTTGEESRLSMHWIAVLHGRTSLSICGGRGVEGSTEAVKLLMAGADVVGATSAVLRDGPAWFTRARADLEQFLDQQDYETVQQLRGSASLDHCADPTGYERVQYLRMLSAFRARIPGEADT